MRNSKIGNIAIVFDERLSRERNKLLVRIINLLRQDATIDIIPGDLTEPELVTRMEARQYQLVLLPWYQYLHWSRVEAFYGLTRTSGPTTAGYFADQILPHMLGDQAEHLRAILLDFVNLSETEIRLMVRILAQEDLRAGIRPLLEPTTPIYWQAWKGFHRLGNLLETVCSLPEIANGEWNKRIASLRICVSAMWSLVYEGGPGKGEFARSLTNSAPKVFFQVAADKRALLIRLCYYMSSWSPKDAVNHFWPYKDKPTSATQLLLSHADFVRVHTIADNPEIEVVAGLLPSAPSEKAFPYSHFLWVEPLSPRLVTELPYDFPENPGAPLKPLPLSLPQGLEANPVQEEVAKTPGAPAGTAGSSQTTDLRDRILQEAGNKIRELKEALTKKDELIQELRSGGVGTAAPLPPPDPENLLEAFQQRYSEADSQIRQLSAEIAQAELRKANPTAIRQLEKKLNDLTAKEESWANTLLETLKVMHENRKKKASGGLKS